jgi:uncharacterized protein YqhQ
MSSEKLPSYGGQALIEGVLMRGGSYLAAAMRTPEGEIVVQSEKLSGIYLSRSRIFLYCADWLSFGMRWA